MAGEALTPHRIDTARHRTTWIEMGPSNGPLMLFIHGWPEIGLLWRAQLEHFAAAGWRCVAPDMRGYGGSSVPTSTGAYAVRARVGDMVELHDALGGASSGAWRPTIPIAAAPSSICACRTSPVASRFPI